MLARKGTVRVGTSLFLREVGKRPVESSRPENPAGNSEAHHDAVRAALSYLQDDATFGRRGQGGRGRIPAGLVVATFEHGTSRALDPQLHTHSLFFFHELGAAPRWFRHVAF